MAIGAAFVGGLPARAHETGSRKKKNTRVPWGVSQGPRPCVTGQMGRMTRCRSAPPATYYRKLGERGLSTSANRPHRRVLAVRAPNAVMPGRLPRT